MLRVSVDKMRLRTEISCKQINSPRKQCTKFLLLTLKFCCLPGKLGKQKKFVTFFVYPIDEIRAIFSNWEPRAQPKLARRYYIFPL